MKQSLLVGSDTSKFQVEEEQDFQKPTGQQKLRPAFIFSRKSYLNFYLIYKMSFLCSGITGVLQNAAWSRVSRALKRQERFLKQRRGTVASRAE